MANFSRNYKALSQPFQESQEPLVWASKRIRTKEKQCEMEEESTQRDETKYKERKNSCEHSIYIYSFNNMIRLAQEAVCLQ